MNKANENLINSLEIPKHISAAISHISKLLGVAAGEILEVFIKQYVVRGLSELFTGIVLVVSSIIASNYIGPWALAIAACSLIFFYGSIQLLGNPKYFAYEDLFERISSFTKGRM